MFTRRAVVRQSLCCIAMLASLVSASAARAARQEQQQPPPSGPALQEIRDFASAWGSVANYSATITVYESKGGHAETVVLAYTFRRPSNVSVHVVSGRNAGRSLQWDGGSTVVAKLGSGLAALFKKRLSLHDPQVLSVRGSSIDELGFGSILAHARDQGDTLSNLPSEAIDGVAALAVGLTPPEPAEAGGLTREVVELSPSTHLPMRVLGFDGATLVRKIDFSQVVLSAE